MTAGPSRRILVIEDDPEIQYLLSVVLAAADREIVAVGDGEAAQHALAEGFFDLVLLDLILPDLDGRTLLTRIREDPATATTPVVVISARSDADIREDCYGLGADAYIEKPFDPEGVEHEVSLRLAKSAGRGRGGLSDPLTGLLNRAGLAARCSEATKDYGLALVQVDGFGALSEVWGWGAAEGVVRQVGDAIRSAVADDAVVGRLGGAEFAVYTPDPTEDDSTAVAERILERVRTSELVGPDGEPVNPTASIGVVEVASDTALDEAVLRARQRLFRAREAGRNQVVDSDVRSEATTARVLVAEDDEISATILLHRLEKEGLDVVRYANGREAYEAALEEVPDLVILDI
ncbi:MAG: response regulator, partial [Gemmatimonadetes bacterium]|nr:response regulator [Gemmatimonadota bacterium]